MGRGLDVATSTLASVVRFGAGSRARAASKTPATLLELYEFEACPFCRRVREALSSLDLDAMVYPCPVGGTRWRPRAVELGGRARFPFLVDPNTGRSLHESAAIVDYLSSTYGVGGAVTSLGPLAIAGGSLAAAIRAGHGRSARPSIPPGKPLELWSFEGCPYCRLVRERLCELELAYVLHNVAKGSPKREAFAVRSGRMMVPFLVDPNAGEGEPARRGIFESADIVRYLDRYAGHG